MLALVMAVALAQCTKDTDCKGERVCADGACVTPNDAPRVVTVEPSAEAISAQRIRLVKAGRLQSELRELREEMDEATIGGPVMKLIGATGLTALGLVLFYAWDSNPRGTAAMFWSAIGTGVLAAGLWIWGGIQLRLRLNAIHELPIRINEKEAELAVLMARDR